jgi:hypothetical protein
MGMDISASVLLDIGEPPKRNQMCKGDKFDERKKKAHLLLCC